MNACCYLRRLISKPIEQMLTLERVGNSAQTGNGNGFVK